MLIYKIITIILSPLLALIMVEFIRRKSKNYPYLWKAFFYGILSLLTYYIFEVIANWVGLNYTSLRKAIVYSFLVVGVGSEIGKYIVLRYWAYKKDNFKGPLNGIAYAVMISLGFVLMSNLLNVIFYKSFSNADYLVFDITYTGTVIIFNVFFAVVMGFFIGLGKYRNNGFVDSMTGLLAASFFHALHYFCFISTRGTGVYKPDYKLLIILGIGMLIITLILLYRAFKINDYIAEEK